MNRELRIWIVATALLMMAGGAVFCILSAPPRASSSLPPALIVLPTTQTPSGQVSGNIDRTRVAVASSSEPVGTETASPEVLPTSSQLVTGDAKKKTTTPGTSDNIGGADSTGTPAASATDTKTATSATATRTLSLTRTPSNTPTITNTPTKTLTPTTTNTPSKTLTPSKTFTPSNTFTPSKTFTPSNTFTPSRTFTATNTKTNTATQTPTFTASSTRTPTFTFTATNTRTSTFTPSFTPTATATSIAPTATFTFTPIASATTSASILEPFEVMQGSWQTFSDTSGTGSVTQSSVQVAAGSFAARASTSSSGSTAKVRYNFSDSAGSHTWEERPGAYYWQWANVYLPSSTVAQLGPTEYLTIAGLWPSASGTQGWFLRVRQGGEMYVVGNRDFDNAPIEFRVYGTFPQDQWVDLEIGLHSQSGPGVKRAFAFLLNGNFYGWYHQGRMQGETYDRAGLGILATNSNDPLEVFVDQWRFSTSASLPSGPDNRSTASLQQQDFTNQSGVQWQIDWTTWEMDLRLESPHGLYSNTNRLQSGRNLDRIPDLTSGWAEIEIDWPKGTPGLSPSSYFGPMVGFRKEINREENLEIIPIGYSGSDVRLTFEAWVGNPVILADWQMPLNAAGTSRIPEPGDIIRTRWDQVSATDLNVQVSYYDASTTTWQANIISITLDVTNINDSDPGTNAVNYTDGFHTASSVTIDSSVYSIRRFQVGTLGTYPGP